MRWMRRTNENCRTTKSGYYDDRKSSVDGPSTRRLKTADKHGPHSRFFRQPQPILFYPRITAAGVRRRLWCSCSSMLLMILCGSTMLCFAPLPTEACIAGLGLSSVQADQLQQEVYANPQKYYPQRQKQQQTAFIANNLPQSGSNLPPTRNEQSITLGPYRNHHQFAAAGHQTGQLPDSQNHARRRAGEHPFGEEPPRRPPPTNPVAGQRPHAQTPPQYPFFHDDGNDLGGDGDQGNFPPQTTTPLLPQMIRTVPPTPPTSPSPPFPPDEVESPRLRYPKDCAEVMAYREGRRNGVYTVFRPSCLNPSACRKQVTCDLETDGGGWTVIQQRLDGGTRFDRDWKSYKDGFGSDKNFWIGNEYLYELTSMEPGETYQLLIQLSDVNGKSIFALYEEFRVDSEANNFRLNLGTMFGTSNIDNLRGSRGADFGSYDEEGGDLDACGIVWESGWWHQRDCRPSGNLNVPYSVSNQHRGSSSAAGQQQQQQQDQGILWQTENGFVPLRTTQMKIRPTNFLPAKQNSAAQP